MLNQNPSAAEGNEFLLNFVEYLEEFPTELSRVCSNVRELDVKTVNILSDVNSICPQLKSLPNGDAKKSKLCMKLHQYLINMQDTCDDKIHQTSTMMEMIEAKYKFLADFKNEPLADISNVKPERERVQSPTTSAPQNPVASQNAAPFVAAPQKTTIESAAGNSSNTNLVSASFDAKNNERVSKRPRRARADTGVDVDVTEVPVKVEPPVVKTQQAQAVANPKRAAAGTGSNKKKKKKVGKQTNQQTNQGSVRDQTVADTFPHEETIDPDEPTYCLCEQISFGEMILCDNDLCPIEWFHFSCVSLITKPKGKWFCPNCRGDRPNVMKNKNQFMKELERYNKEKFSG